MHLPQDGPVVLVLGAAVREDGSPSAALDRRARRAAALWHEGRVRAVVLSGGDRTHRLSEAEVMAEICRAEGVPDSALFLERAAKTTEENFRLSRPILDRLGAREMIVVTDRFHAVRARLVGRRSGFAVRTDCPPVTGVPRWRVLRTWTRETLALVWYWLRGAGRRG